MWHLGDITTKEDLLKLIFPEGIVYDWEKNAFRTSSMNVVFYLIACFGRPNEDNEKRDNYLSDKLSLSTESKIQLSTLFAKDLGKITEFINRFCRNRPDWALNKNNLALWA